MAQQGAAVAKPWDVDAVPDQRGRTALVTGANTGLGFETAATLADRCATVVLACRDTGRAERAAERITARSPAAKVSTLRLDLASLASVAQAADQVRADHQRLDLLINNAGAAFPSRRTTEDGFEAHLGVGHFGHFAFTGLVLDRLLATPGSRIVTVSSTGHRNGTIDFDDLEMARDYRMSAAYSRVKLANLLFTYELQRRLAEAGADTVAVAAHPGVARTEIGRHMPGWMQALAGPRLRFINSAFMQDARMGALPTLRAAVDPDAAGGDYFGPSGKGERKGHPVRVAASPRARDPEVQRKLWEHSERLTRVTYRFTGIASPRS